MRTRTVVAFLVLVATFAGAGALALWGLPGDDASLTELWVSDTARDTEFNHHGVGAAAGVVVAPVTADPARDDLTRRSCALVGLDARGGSVRWWDGVGPDRCFSHALTKPAIADVDGDGRLEVVAGTIENATIVLAAADGREQFRIPMRDFGYGRPTVADVLGDDGPEIVAADISGEVVVAAGNGTVRWRRDVAGLVYASPVVADLDGDGTREVVVGSRDQIVAFDADGTVVWRRGIGANNVRAATVDGETRLVAAGNDGVVALDGATGETAWNRSVAGTPAMASFADGDGDGVPEAYVSVAGNLVRTLDGRDGAEEWQTRLATESRTTTPPAVLADLDGDGDPSLVAATNAGTVAVLDPVTGDELASYRRDVPIWTGVTPANLTRDPGEEILVRYGDGRVVALAADA